MSKKTIVLFLATWDKYSKGDIAGFSPKVAEGLTSAKPAIAELYVEGAQDELQSIDGDLVAGFEKKMNELRDFEAELSRRKTVFDDSAAETVRAHSEKERELNEREADLKQRSSEGEALAAPAPDVTSEEVKPEGEAIPGKPPKQGGKK